jgi:hypothetical protein
LVGVILLVTSAFALDVQTVWQGRLVDAQGNPVVGTHDVHVTLYDDATATGSPHELFTDLFSGVAFDDGYFTVTLGAGVALPSTVFARPDVWAGVRLDAGSELAPRSELADAPTAAWARGVTVPTVPSGCGSTVAAGSLRWTGSAIEVCDGSAWKGVGSGVPVGTVIASMLTPTQFSASVPDAASWVLADGRNVAGTAYATATGASTVPDLRGVFLRGKNNGRSDGSQNPDGDLALGAYQADQFLSHNHSISGFGTVQLHNAGSSYGTYIQSGTRNTDNTGGNETRARNVTVNHYIKVN